MKTLLFLLLILGTASAEAEPLTQVEKETLKIGGLYAEPPKAPFEKYYLSVNQVLNKIESNIQQNSKNPVWWYYRYQAFNSLAGIRQNELISLGMNRSITDNDEEEYINQMNISISKMISVDSDDLPQLNAERYAEVMNVLVPEQKVIAYKRILKFPPYSENSDGRIRDYMGYARAYVDLGRFDDAVQVLASIADDPYIQEIRKYTPSFAKEFSDEWIQAQIDEVWKMKAEHEAAMTDVYAQVEPYAEVAKAEPAAEPYAEPKVVAKPATKAPVVKQEAAVEPEPKYRVPGWLVVGGVIGLLLLVWYVIRRRRK